eukprot:1867777-Pleurochrysis_carterae.AAC.2
MHRRKLGRRVHGGERVIRVLTPCFGGTQEAERRWVKHGDEGAKRGIIRALSSLALSLDFRADLEPSKFNAPAK